MRIHFWLLIALSAGLLGLCTSLLVDFPAQQKGTSIDHQYLQLVTWTGLVCSAGVYATFAACILTHARAGRWRFWMTVALSAIYLWVCGGVLVVLVFMDETQTATPDRVFQVGFCLFLEAAAAAIYAAGLLVIGAANGLRRPTSSMP